MRFTAAIPFLDAIKRLSEKDPLPTTLSSAEIRQRYDADLRERSLFSARTNHAGYLQSVNDQIRELLTGDTNMATARAKLQDQLDALGYTARGGFGGGAVPPAEEGSLRDLSSDRRLQLMLDTNVRQIANFAYRQSGQTDFALHAFPALELVRIASRRVERGSRLSHGSVVSDPGNSWQERWQKAGGTLHGGRMIAAKDDDVWNQLGSASLFDDGLDQPYPPFAFHSGMGVREVPREEAIALGVITEDTDIQGSERSMNEGVEAAADFDGDFLKALKADLGVAISAGKARLKNRTRKHTLRNRAAGVLKLLSKTGEAARS